MAAAKLFNLVALTALALLASSFAPTPVTALSTGHIHHVHRHIAHDVATRRKRDSSKRCKPRPSSAAPAVTSHSASAAPSQQPSKAPQSSKAPPPPAKTTPAPAAVSTPVSSGGGGGVSTSGGKLGLAWANGNDFNVLKNFITPRVHS